MASGANIGQRLFPECPQAAKGCTSVFRCSSGVHRFSIHIGRVAVTSDIAMYFKGRDSLTAPI